MTESADDDMCPDLECAIGGRLSAEEDDDLRRLHWLAQNGNLSRLFEERLLERRLRDRREQVRPPREFDLGRRPEEDRGAIG